MPTKHQLKFIPKNSYEKFGLEVFSVLVENFFQTFFVGGMVRDLILTKNITDLDIATSGKPEEVTKLLEKSGFKIDAKGIKFGVVNVISKHGIVEVSSLRTETYSGSRYPKVRFVNSTTIDAKRRDFTMNSLYYSPKTGKLLDPNKGLFDINKKLIRTVGEANKKFQQDPLRILRALRFAKSLKFNLEEKTQKAIKNNLHLIQTLTSSNIQKELKKLT